jgi:23S rRNA (adenine2503-C2)-methyltransferase
LLPPLDLYNLTREELTQFLAQSGAPRHTGGQVYQWLYRKKAGTFDEMTDLPKTLREELSLKTRLTPLSLAGKQTSADGTVKYLWALPPDAEGLSGQVESVLLPMSRDEEGEAGFYTACISTQA